MADTAIVNMNASPGTADADLFYSVNGGADFKTSALQIQTYVIAAMVAMANTFVTGQVIDGTLQLGTASATTGQLLLANSASANLTTIQAGNAAAAITYTWPTNVGGAGTVLTDAAGDGTLSWAAGGGGTPGGADTQVQFNDAGAFGGDAGLTYNKTTNVLTNTGGSIVSTGGTITASLPALSVTQTWNNAGVKFAGVLINITPTADNAEGGALTIQRSGTDFVRFVTSSAAGSQNYVSIQGATTTAPRLALALSTDTSARLSFGLDGSDNAIIGMGAGGVSARDNHLSRNAAGVIQFGTTAANASGAWLAAKGTLTGGTLADQGSVLAITATQPASPSTTQSAINITITSAGSAAQVNRGLTFTYAAGYTGASATQAWRITNAVAGTATEVLDAGASGLNNAGFSVSSEATTTGTNIGGVGRANGGNINIGIVGIGAIAKNSAVNIGVAGFGLNTGTTPVQVAGYFGMYATTPTLNTSAALIADNGAQTSAIFLARDNGTTTFTIADGGAVTNTSSETIMSGTAIPAGGTAGAGYKFSSTSNFGVFFGSGAPGLAAAKGSLYLRSDGSGVTDRAYINTDGGTTWTALTTAG